MIKHIAVKCTYNDGGQGDFVGFSETCSEKTIKENTQKHVWCRQPECECMKYAKRGFKDDPPQNPCMESKLFKAWEFGAGTFHTGKRQGQPKKAHFEQGGICFLTTRFPGDKEEDRKIIGLYRVGKVTNHEGEETKFFADQTHRIRLPFEEAIQLFFWDYYSVNSPKPLWGSGLLRYLNDGQVKKILLDLEQTVQSVHHKEILKELLKDFDGITPSAKGQRKSSFERRKRIAMKRKYGAGGEGENHRRLKEWVAKHPQAVGIESIKRYEMEYVFLSGDTADILFEVSDSNDAVVEIETTIPLPGCHQAIKYRALRCAELSLQLHSEKVKAILVPWEIPQNVRDFCNRYDILHYEIKK